MQCSLESTLQTEASGPDKKEAAAADGVSEVGNDPIASLIPYAAFVDE